MTRRRKRDNLKDFHCHIKTETYLYISEYLGPETSLGAALDQIIKEHREYRNGTTTFQSIASTPVIQ